TQMSKFTQVFQLRRLLDKQRTQLLNSRAKIDSHYGSQLSMGVNRNIEIITHRGTHSGETLGRFTSRVRRHNNHLVDGDETRLRRRVAFLFRLLECFHSRTDVFVHTDSLAGGAAEQLIDRNIQSLAKNVPQGDLNSAYCRVKNWSSA